MNLTLIYLKRFFPVELNCHKITFKKKLLFNHTRYVILIDKDKYTLDYLLSQTDLGDSMIRNIVYRHNGDIFNNDTLLVFCTEEECNAAIKELREAMFIMTFVKEML